MVREHIEGERPPEPPEIDRRVRLPWAQLIGFPLIALVPLLAIADVFDERWETDEAAGAKLWVQVEYPSQFRSRLSKPMTVRVENRSTEAVIRVAYVYLLLMVALRIMGKRELSQLSPFDLVTLILIPELFSDALAHDDFSMTNATISVTTLLTLVFLTTLLTFRFRTLDHLVSGEPVVLVHRGTFLERNLGREHVKPEEVYAEMRKSGAVRLNTVQPSVRARAIARRASPTRSGRGR